MDPPFDSTILEISLAEILSVPLKIMCSKKWDTPESGPDSLHPAAPHPDLEGHHGGGMIFHDHGSQTVGKDFHRRSGACTCGGEGHGQEEGEDKASGAHALKSPW